MKNYERKVRNTDRAIVNLTAAGYTPEELEPLYALHRKAVRERNEAVPKGKGARTMITELIEAARESSAANIRGNLHQTKSDYAKADAAKEKMEDAEQALVSYLASRGIL
jgi:molybdate-binding protein